MARIDYKPGQIINNLTFIKRIENDKAGNVRAELKCYCGKIFKTAMYNVRRKAVVSCGCYWLKKTKEANIIHGDSQDPTSLYKTRGMIIQRCYNNNHTNYNNYGKRNITLYFKWKESYLKFKNYILNNIGPFNIKTKKFERPLNETLDRINNNGNYEPGNIRWATSYEQSLNSSKAKLTKKEVIKIKALLKENKLLQKEISILFNISDLTISNISTKATHHETYIINKTKS